MTKKRCQVNFCGRHGKFAVWWYYCQDGHLRFDPLETTSKRPARGAVLCCTSCMIRMKNNNNEEQHG